MAITPPVYENFELVKIKREDYGQQAFSYFAAQARWKESEYLTNHHNIATFYFAKPGQDVQYHFEDYDIKNTTVINDPWLIPSSRADDDPVIVTEASTGYTIRNIKENLTNRSHSEKQIIQYLADDRKNGDKIFGFPAKRIIKWIYTERKPCTWPPYAENENCTLDIQKLQYLQNAKIVVFYTYENNDEAVNNVGTDDTRFYLNSFYLSPQKLMENCSKYYDLKKLQ
jgi:hypothetical protein